MLAMLCSIYIATQAITCQRPVTEQEAKEAYLDQWSPWGLGSGANQSEPFVVREVDPDWSKLLKVYLQH